MATPPKSSQAVPPTGTKYSNIWTYGGYSHSNHHINLFWKNINSKVTYCATIGNTRLISAPVPAAELPTPWNSKDGCGTQWSDSILGSCPSAWDRAAFILQHNGARIVIVLCAFCCPFLHMLWIVRSSFAPPRDWCLGKTWKELGARTPVV